MGRKKKWKVVFVVLMGMMTAGAGEADIDMKEGKWEITAKMEMPGMPMQMPAVTTVQCLSGENKVPKIKQTGEEGQCRITHSQMRGKTYIWDVECTAGGRKMSSHGEITYEGETFSGFVRIVQDGMTMTNRMQGRWIGPCNTP